jgi:uncharacterized Zn-finger protein
MSPTELQKPQACTEQIITLTEADLPLACPSRHLRIWDAHPRVYLPLAAEGRVVCPYCSAIYLLEKS